MRVARRRWPPRSLVARFRVPRLNSSCSRGYGKDSPRLAASGEGQPAVQCSGTTLAPATGFDEQAGRRALYQVAQSDVFFADKPGQTHPVWLCRRAGGALRRWLLFHAVILPLIVASL